ncbi:hypothetical protein ACO0K0_03685 [Undibacterium sp. SXout11W]|uniref:hypothetical protein n=1 Tax=Undibacterium sp. SXout11W TaxID=3413050 RepID=UPI003BF3F559
MISPATQVYQADRANDHVTVKPVGIIPPADIVALQVGLKNIDNRLEVTGVPQAGGTINADMIKYYSAAKKR